MTNKVPNLRASSSMTHTQKNRQRDVTSKQLVQIQRSTATEEQGEKQTEKTMTHVVVSPKAVATHFLFKDLLGPTGRILRVAECDRQRQAVERRAGWSKNAVKYDWT